MEVREEGMEVQEETVHKALLTGEVSPAIALLGLGLFARFLVVANLYRYCFIWYWLKYKN